MTGQRIPAQLVLLNGRPTLRFELATAASVDHVWQAVSVPAELGQWFPSPVDWIPAVGEAITIDDLTGNIIELFEPQLLSWDIGPEHYRFEIHGTPGGSTFIFLHTFDANVASAAQYAAGWEAYLDRLNAHLSGSFLSEEDAHARTADKLKLYTDLFEDGQEA